MYNIPIMQKLFSFFFSLFVIFSLFVSPAFAQQTSPLEGGQSVPGNEETAYVVDGVVTIQAIEGVVANILSIAVSGIGFAGFVMLIIGSFKYLLSGGDTKGTEGGKNTMTYAVVGLLVALTSWMILNFIATFTGVDTITRFSLFFNG